ncbi:MAG: hypothetical protein JXM70_27235 [Pirellulales bacterium]|nr:hypothetical protein [Pirellulales bacterium]
MNVWETLWSLDDVEAFEVFAPPICTVFAVCIVLCLVTAIYRVIHGRRMAGRVVLEVRPRIGARIAIGLLGVILVIASLVAIFCAYWLFHVFFIKPYAGSDYLDRPLPPEFYGNMGRVLLPLMVCLVVGSPLVLLCGIENLSGVFHSFTIRDAGILAYINSLSIFSPWEKIRRAVWFKPNTVRIELDNRIYPFSVHSRDVGPVTETLGRFVEVVDYETYKAVGEKVYSQPRTRFQFRLRTLMLVTLLLAIFFGSLGSRLHEALHVRQICEKLVRSGASVDRWGLVVLYVGWHKDTHPPTNDVLAILEDLDCVTWIGIFGPQITDEGLRHFRTLTTLQILNLDKTIVKGKGLEYFTSLERLEELTLRESAIDDTGCVHLAGLTGLKYLELDKTKISGTSLGHLAEIQTLTVLSLDYAPITDGGLQQIGKIKSLKRLNLNGTQITDDGLAHLAGLTNLTSLDLDNTKITGKGLGRLAAIPGLTNLSLKDTSITDEGMRYVGKLKNLDKLNLSGTQVTDAGLVHLAGLINLKDLTLDDTRISGNGFEHITSLKALSYLSLQGTNLTDKGLVHLKHLSEMKIISLNRTAVTKAAAEKILPDVFRIQVPEQNDLQEDEPDDGGSEGKLPVKNVSDSKSASTQ